MSILEIKHIPRPSWGGTVTNDVDPMLHGNIESWPHLEELAQCLKSDYIHVENKYGVFQSVPLHTFEHQAFESEESDTAALKKVGSHNGESALTNGDLNSDRDRDHQPSYGPPIVAYDPVFNWEVERAAVVGQRLPGPTTVTMSSGTRFSVRMLSCDIQVGLVEPIYGSMCLFNLERKEKLSEDFYFQFLPNEWPGESTSPDTRVVFSVDVQSPSVCLLVQLEKPASEESANGIKASVYSRKEPKLLSDKEAQRLVDWAQMMPFREAFAWVTVPMFDASVTGGVGGFGHSADSTPSAPHSPSGSIETSQTSTGGYSFGGPPVLVEVPQLNRVKEGYTDDFLVDPKRKVHKPVRAVMQFEVERLPAEVPVVSGPLSATKDGRIPAGTGQDNKFRALDFRIVNHAEPLSRLLHCLFVYPQTVVLPKKYNLFIRIELRSDDTDLQKPAIEGICSREGQGQMLRSAFSQVVPGARVAMYHDEFKVRLPAVLTPQHHLLFTFYHIDLVMRSEPPRPTVVGYAVLPLSVGAQVLRSDVSLPVSKDLQPHYLQDSVKRHLTYWEEGRLIYRVRTRMCSSIYPVSDRMREFFRVYDRHVLLSAPPGPELLDAINKLKEVDLTILLQFLYPVLNMLLCMIGNGVETLQVAAFRAMVNIITNVQKASMESSPRNRFLVHFVDYVFDDLGRQQLPVYPGLCNVWRSLARSKAKGYRVGPVYDDALSMAWFVLELIVKSMDLELAQVPQGEEIARLRLEDEVYQCIWQLFDCLLTEVQERARRGHPLARHLNSSIAFFCYDLLSVVDPPQVFDLVGLYLTKFAGMCPPELHRFKLTFLHILADHDFYIETPGRVPAEKNYLTTVLLKELFVSLDHEDSPQRSRAARTLAFLTSKHEHDRRYQPRELKLYIAQLYYPIIGMILEEVTVYYNLTALEKRNVLICQLSIVRNLDEETLQRSWSQSITRTSLFFQLLQESLVLFEYKRPVTHSGSLQTVPNGSPEEEPLSSPKYSDKLSSAANNFFAEATKTTDKSALREYLLRKMGVPGISGSVNARMPIKEAMVAAQVTAREASRIIREGLPPALKHKLDLWESNLSSWVSLEVLSVLRTFSDAAAQKAVMTEYETMEAITGPLAELLLRSQSLALWREFLPVFARILEQHGATLLSNGREKFLRDITFHLMRRLVYRSSFVRRAALLCLHLILRASLVFFHSARRMKAVFTITLSELISDMRVLQSTSSGGHGVRPGAGGSAPGALEDAPPLQRLTRSIQELGSVDSSLELLREYGVPETVLAGVLGPGEEHSRQWEEVHELQGALLRVLDASRDHAQLLEGVNSSGDRHALVESYYGLAQAYAHVPDLRIMWLLHLGEAHQEMQQWAEAAQCAISVAAIIMKALVASKQSVYNSDHLASLQRICSVVDVEGDVEGGRAPTDLDGFGATTLTADSAVKYLQMGNQFFRKAEIYQFCAELLELILPIHKSRRAYAQLSRCHTALTGTYEMVLQQETNPIPFKDSAYYRVGFYGSRFKSLNRKEYIYREGRNERLGDIMEKLGKLYEQRSKGDEPLHIIPDSRQVDPNVLKQGYCFMQITAVEPVVGEDSERWMGRTPEPALAGAPVFDCFMFDSPFTEAGKTQGGLEDQWKRRTLLYTAATFPSVVNRLEVVRSEVREYSPLDNAISVIESRTHALESELHAQGADSALVDGSSSELRLPRLQSLQRLLQGSVALQVNSGVLGVCVAFLCPVEDGLPQAKDEKRFSPAHIQNLTEAILSFVAICKRGIAVHARAIKEGDQDFHSQLVEGFECLVVEIARFIPEIR